MKVLIVDDLDFKRKRIKDYVKNILTDVEFEEFSCGRDMLNYLRPYYLNEKDKDNLKDILLFLDWNFPLYKNEMPNVGEGMTILFHIDRRKLPLKTIIVSSDDVELDEDYPFVLGTIKDDSSVYQQPIYEEYIKQFKEREDILWDME